MLMDSKFTLVGHLSIEGNKFPPSRQIALEEKGLILTFYNIRPIISFFKPRIKIQLG